MSEMVQPFEYGRFFRLGSERMSLATAARGGDVGFGWPEGWVAASGLFAYSTDPSLVYAGAYSDMYRDVYRRNGQVRLVLVAVASAWRENKSGSDAVVYDAVNGALRSAGYTTADGSVIS